MKEVTIINEYRKTNKIIKIKIQEKKCQPTQTKNKKSILEKG